MEDKLLIDQAFFNLTVHLIVASVLKFDHPSLFLKLKKKSYHIFVYKRITLCMVPELA